MDDADPDVVRLAVAGDQQAVADVMATVRRVAVRYCRARMGPVARSYITADDVAQEICEAVLVGLPRLRGPLLPFVYGVAHHKITDALRRGLRASPTVDTSFLEHRPDRAASPEEAAINTELWTRLRPMIRALNPVQREIVVLRVMVGLSAEQTGLALGMSPGAVRLAQHRALQKLRTLARSATDGVNQ